MGGAEPAGSYTLANRGLLVDLDGVLIDTEGVWRQAYIHVFAERHGYEVSGAELDLLYGLNAQKVVKTLADAAGVGSASEILDLVLQYVAREVERQQPIMQASVEFVKAAQGLGARTAIVSSSPRFLVEIGTKVAGIWSPGILLISGDDVSAHKPSPEPYIAASRSVGVAPQYCLAVEDSPAGVRSALTGGVPTIWLRRSHNAEQVHESTKCIAIVGCLDLVNAEAAFRCALGQAERAA